MSRPEETPDRTVADALCDIADHGRLSDAFLARQGWSSGRHRSVPLSPQSRFLDELAGRGLCERHGGGLVLTAAGRAELERLTSPAHAPDLKAHIDALRGAFDEIRAANPEVTTVLVNAVNLIEEERVVCPWEFWIQTFPTHCMDLSPEGIKAAWILERSLPNMLDDVAKALHHHDGFGFEITPDAVRYCSGLVADENARWVEIDGADPEDKPSGPAI